MQSTDAVARVAAARSALFVPGDRPERFAKAEASGAEIVILDLEDAVSNASKSTARVAVVEALKNGFSAVVRVNTPGSEEFHDDLASLTGPEAPAGLLGIMIPKVENPAILNRVRALLGADRALVALIESARGVRNVGLIAEESDCTRLAFGAIDFSLDIGSSTDAQVLAPVRSLLVVASRAAGMAPPLDTPTTEFRDVVEVEVQARLSKASGFGGKLCIHPAQVPAVHAAFEPSQAEFDWAKRVLAANDAANGAAVQLDGQMVDLPVVARARGILSSSHERQKA